MAGFDDPRFLQQVITDLQTRLKKLEGNTLPLAVNQRGPIPGYMRAVQIGDANQKSAMWLNLAGNVPGQAPYQAVTDASGVIRYETGNLAANGISSAQLGWRTNDPNGVVISDSLGQGLVMPILARGGTGTTQSITSSTPVLLNNSQITFSLIRSSTIFFEFGAAVQLLCTGDGGSNLIDIYIDGALTGDSPSLFYPCVTSGATTEHAGYSKTLAAGSHTAELRGSRNGTNTMTVTGNDITAYGVGK